MKKLCPSLRGACGLILWNILAAAASAAPVVFNSTESAYPGDVIYLQGDNFTATPEVYFYLVTGTEPSLDTPLGLSSTTTLSNITSSGQALTAAIPQNIPLGLYAVWVKDSGGDFSAPVFINQARATSFEYSQVPPGYHFRIFGRNLCLNNGATPKVAFVDVNSGSSYPAVVLTGTSIVTTSTNDSNVLMVQAPSGISGTNTYNVEVSNGSGTGAYGYDVTPAMTTIQSRASGSDVFNLGVPWGSDFANIAASVINIRTGTNPHTGQLYSAGSGTYGGYWNNAIQQALYDAGNPAYHPNGATVYLPSGTYPMNWSYETGTTTSGTIGGWTGSNWTKSGTFFGPTGAPFDLDSPPNNQSPTGQFQLDLPANVVLQGAGIGNTVINDYTPAFSGYTYFITYAADSGFVNSSNHIGVQGFTYNQDMTVTATTSPPSIRNYAVNSTDLFWDHIQVNGAHLISGTETAIHSSFLPADSNDTNVLVQSSTFNYVTVGGANAGDYGNNYIFRISTIASWYTYINFPFIGNMVFEGNTLTRNADFPPPGFAGLDNGGFQSSGSDKIILNNTFNAINVSGSNQLYYQGQNHGQSITCQSGVLNGYGQYGPGPTDTGTATAATNKTLTDSAKSWTTNEFAAPAEEILMITGGPGAGEWAPITSNTGTTITISGTWAITPSGSSPASTFAVKNNNGYLMGTVTSSDTTTLTDSTQDWPTNFYAGESVAIISGPGMGQIATITGNTSDTLTFSPAWTEAPESTSHYAINAALQYGAHRWLIKGNTLQSVLRGVLMYLGGYDCAVTGNKLASSGGILFDAWQRSIIGSGSSQYDRFDIAWRNVITDNVATDPDNTNAAYLATQADTTTGSPLFGTLALGIENRRNVLEGSNPNLVDGAYGPHESFVNLTGQATSGDDASGTSILNTVYMDNVSISCTNVYRVNTAVSQTPIQDAMTYNCGLFLSDTMLPGCTTSSTMTETGTTAEGLILNANFSGSGASIGTGGTGENMVDVGATGKLVQGNYDNEISIEDDTPFDTDSGSYLHTVFTGTGNVSTIQYNPVSPRYSWSRIFDQRSGQWIVNGAFDFFYRPGQTNTNTAQFRPLDIASGTYTGTGNGMRMIMNTTTLTTLLLQIGTGTNGGSLLLTGTIPKFQADTVYHIGVTFATNVTSGTTIGTNGTGANGTTPYHTTVKMYFQGGTTGEMSETGTTLIATGTITLNHAVVNDASPADWFNGGPWTFNGYNVSGLPTTNDYDGFRMYYKDPGTFPALDDATP